MKELDSFTVERLEELIKSASLEPCDAEPIYDNVQVREIAALARIALAAKRAEESHSRREVWDGGNTWVQCSRQAYDRHEAAGKRVRVLYERPQLNSQVPLGSWINCIDQMPEDDTLCLGVDECGVIWTMHFDDGEFQPDTGDVDDLKISHWMSLPDAPEKENG
ncbi:DUF551 domain-containing protein [Yersinia massiliensis]|uniref:DUF551 domain-containing protein n=1 Tax=Yersinia massiliensis TaxID=419257 RepID=UPI000C149922|nr:DUF551 domain-containing protein [Yersinia massiliensis]PHZ22204.1 hypothetical protein CS535_18040 [Yersinia massiliensis]